MTRPPATAAFEGGSPAPGKPQATGARAARQPWLDPLLVLLLIAVAALFRLWQISSLPPGLSYDEADWGHRALQILGGRLFFVDELGTLHAYLAAPFIAWMGRIPLALRLPEALAGIATTALLYLWVREAFGSRLVSFTAAAVYAITFETVHLSRLAFPPNPLSLVQVVTYYFFWRGWRRNELGSLAISGLFLGLALHTYQAGLFLALAMGLAWLAWIVKRRRDSLRPAAVFWGAFLLLAIPFAWVVLPSLPYLNAPRYGSQFIFNPAIHQGAPLQTLLVQLGHYLGMFGFTGDQSWRHNIPGRPLFDLALSLLFWGGVLVALRRLRSAAYAFLLLQMSVLMLPGLLAWTSSGPLLLHVAGILVPACVFPALLAGEVYRFARRGQAWAGAAVLGLLLALLIVEGYRTAVDYFQVWAEEVKPTMSFDELFVDAARVLNASPWPVDAWIAPKAGDQPDRVRPSSFAFIYTGDAPVTYVQASDQVAPEKLAEALQGAAEAGLVTWDWDALRWAAPVYGDAKGLLPFLMGRAGELDREQRFDGFTLSGYALPAQPTFALPSAQARPADATFGREIALDSLDLGAEGHDSVPSGEALWLALHWRALQPPGRDLKAVVMLRDRQGHLILQDDQLLRDDSGATTSAWQPGQGGWDGRGIEIPPGTPPGDYDLEVAVYAAATLEKLPVTAGGKAGARVALVDAVTVDPAVAKHKPAPPVDLSISLGDPPWLKLRGRDPFPEQARPGDTLTLTWYWQILQDAPPGGTVHVSLVDSDGTVVQEAQLPIDSTYPTSQWTAGQWMVTRDDLRLDRALPAGPYTLRVQVESGGFVQPVDAGTINVLGWPRQYQLPASIQPTDTAFGDDLKLVGYGLPAAGPGQALEATLCWQALREMATGYVTFAHLVDAQGAVMSQVDMVPGQGAYPTSGWLPGEIVCSDYDLALPADLPAGDYSLAVGVYDPQFEERLPAAGAFVDSHGNQALIPTGIGR